MTRGACPCRDQTSASEPSTYWLHRAWKSCKKRSFSTFPPCLLLLLGKRGFSWLPSVTNHSEREQNRPVAALFPNIRKFPKTTVGSRSKALLVKVSNPSTAAITFSSIDISGANAGDFLETTTCGGTLGVHASCTVAITFQPSQIGVRTATLTFHDNAIGQTQSVSLTGTGR